MHILRPPLPRSLLVAAPILLAGGCGTRWDVSEQDGMTVLRTDFPTDAAGVAEVKIPIDAEDAFLLTMSSETNELAYIESLTEPGGDQPFIARDEWDAPNNRTNAGYASETPVINWPIAATDGALSSGRYRVRGAIDAARAQASFEVHLKDDADLASGSVHVVIWRPTPFAGNEELDRALDAALDVWRDEIYGPIGLDLSWEQRTEDYPAAMDSPGFGSPEIYADLSGKAPGRVVNVVLVNLLTDAPDVFGIAGGIPGPPVPSGRSAVAISVLEAQGADGRFSFEEEALLAETMAHEVGHYLGLFHPLEIPQGNDPVSTWDDHEDTADCSQFAACAVRLGQNLMFPTPLCAEGDVLSCRVFVRQTELSAQQAGVVHRNVLVD